MKNTKKSALFALLLAGTCALTGCDLFGKKKQTNGIVFWSSFGATYKNALDVIVNEAQEKTGIEITHISQNNYDNIKTVLNSAIAVWKSLPDIAMGYPDHFAEYIGNDALVQLDDLMSDVKSDYIGDYMDENYFWNEGENHLYGVPFNKSTEVLGYNGTFVAYCATKDPDLANVPTTWQEWEEKGPAYMEWYDHLIDGRIVLCGVQDVNGHCHDFVEHTAGELHENEDGELEDANGKIALLDFSKFTYEKKAKTRLMSWDATDNAFITLIRQWGAEYTKLDESEHQKHALYQQGKVVFGSSTNMPIVVDCMKFFNRLSKNRIFGIPAELNSLYSSDAFAECSVMFMVCSSGGLSYNTKTWHNDFTVAPIPYYDDGNGTVRKSVISQGANICVLDTGKNEEAAKVVKDLTTGETQVDWCLNTGYYPCSKSASTHPKYTSFINEAEPASINAYVSEWNAKAENADKQITYTDREKEVYSKPSRVAYRQGSKVNEESYMAANSGWHKFTDVAFYGSSGVRLAVKNVLKIIFREIGLADINNTTKYENIIKNDILKDGNITQNETNVKVVLD